MGSRIMHLIIANEVANILQVQEKTAFLLGGIAADATSNKDASHFFKGNAQQFTRCIDYNGFSEKYNLQAKNEYVLGYYSHLIADDIWLQGFYLPWLKNRMEANSEMGARYHEDFRLLNGKLIEHYRIGDSIKKELTNEAKLIDLEEVKSEEVMNFVNLIVEDFNYDQSTLNVPLTVFTLDQIIGYIHTSIEKSIFLMAKKDLIQRP